MAFDLVVPLKESGVGKEDSRSITSSEEGNGKKTLVLFFLRDDDDVVSLLWGVAGIIIGGGVSGFNIGKR